MTNPNPSAAALIAELGGIAEKLIAEHGPNAHGRCRAGCHTGGANAGSDMWPCRLRELAEAARDRRLPAPSEATKYAPPDDGLHPLDRAMRRRVQQVRRDERVAASRARSRRAAGEL